jgi:hypothetical protein
VDGDSGVRLQKHATHSSLLEAGPNTPERLAFLGTFEFATNDAEWWRIVLDMLATTRFNKSPRYQAYLDFLTRFLPVASNTATGFDLENLNVAQKWLLMYCLDIFADHIIVFHNTPNDWFEAWKENTEMMVPGFHGIVDDPTMVDNIRLTRAWNELRAVLC